eukprot:scaffold594994_cov15-Prasinocladus_malaysianus.AAC.2
MTICDAFAENLGRTIKGPLHGCVVRLKVKTMLVGRVAAYTTVDASNLDKKCGSKWLLAKVLA